MREMKGSGVEWIGEVPRTWRVERFKGLAINVTEPIPQGSSLSVPLENVEPWTGKLIDAATSEDSEGCAKGFCRGDVLFSKLRPYLAKVFCAPCTGACSGEMLVLRPKDIDSKFLSYYLMSPSTVDEINGLNFGAKMPRADWNIVCNLRVPLPPIKEQRRIVSFLDGRCAAIDDDIAKRREVIEKLKEYKKALIARAVTKGLDSNAEMKDSGIEWLGEVPSHWGLTKIKFAASICNGLDYSSEDVCSAEREGATLVVRSSNIKDGRMVRCDDVYVDMDIKDSCLLQQGDLVIVRANGSPRLVGKCALHNLEGKCAAGGFMLICRSVYNQHLRWVLQSGLLDYYRGSFDTSTIGRISSTLLGDMVIPWPSTKERSSIDAFLEKRCSAIDEAVLLQERLIEKLGEYRRSIIHHAVTGKIDCTEAMK